MKKQGKRLLSVILTASMLMNAMAFPALADGGTSGGQSRKTASGNEASASDAERESDAVKPEEPKAEEPEKETKAEETEAEEPEKETGVKAPEGEDAANAASKANTEEEASLFPDECICKDQCTEDNMNGRCPVCGADNAGPEDCLGGEAEVVLEDYMVIPEGLFSDLPDNEELFAGYVELVFYGDGGIALYGNFGEDRLEGRGKRN